MLLRHFVQNICPRAIACSRSLSSANVQPVDMAYDVYETANTDKSKPPLIIMHGLFGSKQNWRGISRALEAKLKCRVYAVDARNHGDSPHTNEHSSREMSADIEKFMQTYRIPKANLLGHSMGGRTMMYFTLKYPQLVHKTIIVDISPTSVPTDFSEMRRIFEAMQTINVPINLSLAQGRVNVEKQLKKALDDKGTVDFIMLNLRKRPSGEFHWAVNVDALASNLHMFGTFQQQIAAFPAYTGAVHFINGKHSSFVEPSNWPEVQKIFPNATEAWLDAGHLVHFDAPADFINEVQRFLN